MVDLNRVFSLAYFVGSGKCHERLQCRHSASSGVRQTRRLSPPPEASGYTISVRRNSTSADGSRGDSPSSSTTPGIPSTTSTTGEKIIERSSAASTISKKAAWAKGALGSRKVPSVEFFCDDEGCMRSLTRAEEDGVSVSVEFRRGVPQLTVPLPSRRERCRFTLRPISNTVGDFLSMLQHEDKGIDRVSVLTEDGVRIASSSTIESLLMDNFRLTINDVEYKVNVPGRETLKISKDDLNRLSDVRILVHQLYEALNVEEHQIKKERELLEKLESLKVNLEPLEKKRQSLEALAIRRTTALTWVGLGLMSVQFGILARLTWWEYSWDIMEPVTYFVTYGTAMAAYAYFVLTKQEYLLPDVRDRQHLITLHKRANKVGLDVQQYNTLKDEIARTEYDLSRLRDPLRLHLASPQRTSSSGISGVASSLSSSAANASPIDRLRTMFGKLRREKSRP